MRSATRAGYSVYSIDCFNDVDTENLAIQSFQIDLFTSAHVLNEIETIIDQIGLDKLDAVIIGSGFEHQIDLIKQLSKRIPVLCNTSDELEKSLSAQYFFELLNDLSIPYPEVLFDTKNLKGHDWLLKSLSSAGGYDVNKYVELNSLSEHQYLQRYVKGTLISVNVVANGSSHYVYGINRFWCCDQATGDFRYAGAMSHYPLSEQVKQQMKSIVNKVCESFNLRGLCGLDFIMDQTQQLFLIDINPRPTATFELYDDESGSLFEAHLAAFLDNQLKMPVLSDKSKGHQIVYSEKAFKFPNDYQWPDWAICRTKPDKLVENDEPICIVLAKDDAVKTLNNRTKQILNSV